MHKITIICIETLCILSIDIHMISMYNKAMRCGDNRGAAR